MARRYRLLQQPLLAAQYHQLHAASSTSNFPHLVASPLKAAHPSSARCLSTIPLAPSQPTRAGFSSSCQLALASSSHHQQHGSSRSVKEHTVPAIPRSPPMRPIIAGQAALMKASSFSSYSTSLRLLGSSTLHASRQLSQSWQSAGGCAPSTAACSTGHTGFWATSISSSSSMQTSPERGHASLHLNSNAASCPLTAGSIRSRRPSRHCGFAVGREAEGRGSRSSSSSCGSSRSSSGGGIGTHGLDLSGSREHATAAAALADSGAQQQEEENGVSVAAGLQMLPSAATEADRAKLDAQQLQRQQREKGVAERTEAGGEQQKQQQQQEQEEEEGGRAPPTSLEVTVEARELFEEAWSEMVGKVGEEQLFPPKEIVWLNGAPGAGKGANTPFILRTRGFEARAIEVSDLLEGTPEVASVMRSGGLVTDCTVLRLVLKKIMTLGNLPSFVEDADHGGATENSASEGRVAGAVVDGFPRTTMQVDFIKLLHDKLMELHFKFLGTPLEPHFSRPIFRIAVLYVEEEESVRRQLARGHAAIAHNQRVLNSGIGTMMTVRATDLCEKSARRRYHIFRQHYDTLLRLKAFFPFHLIDAMGTLTECREQIEKELQYQSALELNATTFRSICHIPLASDIAKNARQNMVARLEGYQQHSPGLFHEVVQLVYSSVIPIIRKGALAGEALFMQPLEPGDTDATFKAEMLVDILTERGYTVTWQEKTQLIPAFISDRGRLTCEEAKSIEYHISFERPQLRQSSSSLPSHTSSVPPHKSASPLPSSSELVPPPPVLSSRMCTSLPGGQPPCLKMGGGCHEHHEEGQDTSPSISIPGLPKGSILQMGQGCPEPPAWVKEAATMGMTKGARHSGA